MSDFIDNQISQYIECLSMNFDLNLVLYKDPDLCVSWFFDGLSIHYNPYGVETMQDLRDFKTDIHNHVINLEE